MKVTIATLIRTNKELVDLAAAALPARIKYWVRRIATSAHAALQHYEQQRVALVTEYGEPVRFEPQPHIKNEDGSETPQPLKRIVLTAEEAAKENHTVDVPESKVPEFMERLAELQGHEVELSFNDQPYNMVPLSGFGDCVLSVNIDVLDWMIDEAV